MRRPSLVLLVACAPLFWCALPSGAQAMTRSGLPTEIRRQLPVRLQNVSARLRRTAALKRLESVSALSAKRRPSLRTVQSSSSSSTSHSLPVTDRREDRVQEATTAASSAASSARSSLPRQLLVPSDPVKAEVLRLVNEERLTHGLAALSNNALLEQSAQDYAEWMEEDGFFGHRDPDGNASATRIGATGYLDVPCDCAWAYATGENLAKGQSTPAQVVKDWMQSPSHRDNILSPGFQEIGIGVSGGLWVQHFGSMEWK